MKIDLREPGTALVMNRTDQTLHRVRLPCFDPVVDLDCQQARLNEAVEILSLLITTAEHILPGQATDQAIAGAASMLRRAVNLISADIQPVDHLPELLSDLSSATS